MICISFINSEEKLGVVRHDSVAGEQRGAGRAQHQLAAPQVARRPLLHRHSFTLSHYCSHQIPLYSHPVCVSHYLYSNRSITKQGNKKFFHSPLF
jgi:hypothetical protein